MQDTIDLLQIKIEDAKKQLSKNTLDAIAAVPWQAEILKMRETKGYTFEQLGDLELETELLLCGLVSPEDYPREIEKRMQLSKAEVDDLVKEMNSLVFSKIKDELMKNTNSAKIILAENKIDAEKEKENTQVLRSVGIEIIPDLPAAPSAQLMQTGKLELNSGNILAQKLSGPVKNEVIKTEHSLNNLTKSTEQPAKTTSYKDLDPYREKPE